MAELDALTSGTALLVFLVAFINGWFTSWLAHQKGYAPVTWLFLGMLFNVLALLTMVGAPVRQAPPAADPVEDAIRDRQPG